MFDAERTFQFHLVMTFLNFGIYQGANFMQCVLVIHYLWFFEHIIIKVETREKPYIFHRHEAQKAPI
jgi:hypothetical protein